MNQILCDLEGTAGIRESALNALMESLIKQAIDDSNTLHEVLH